MPGKLLKSLKLKYYHFSYTRWYRLFLEIRKFFGQKYWFLLAIVIFLFLWWSFLDLYPIRNFESAPDLPTGRVIYQLNDGGYLSIICLNGEAFENRIVQGDILRCKLEADEQTLAKINGSINISVVGWPQIEGNTIPEEDYRRNKRWYSHTLHTKDFTQNEVVFWIKVPSIKSFSFFVAIPGYHPTLPQYLYISTKLGEYIRVTLPKIQLLFTLLTVFVTTKYLRDLWRDGS